MQRIDTSTKFTDLFGAGKHGFRDGNKAGGIAATALDAVFFNNIQEEICRVIEAAGIALSGASFDQLLTALRSAGVFTTSAQFDNTTKAATTAFVQRALGNLAGTASFTGAATLTAAHLGKAIEVQSATPFTLGLPAANLVGGGVLRFKNTGAGAVTLARAGSDVITSGVGDLTSIVLSAGDTLELYSSGVATWYMSGGSASLGKFAGFSASSGLTGYQKLPSGVIRQWGQAVTNASGVATFTFPVPFISSASPPQLTIQNGGLQGDRFVNAGAATLTQVSAYLSNMAGTAVSGQTINFEIQGI